jgi:hypothetical protein
MGVAALRIIATGLPILAIVGLVVVGIWALLQLRSASVRSRRDRPFAFILAALAGVAVGGFVVLVGVGFAYMDSPAGPPLSAYLTALPIVIAVGAPVAIACLAGYALLIRTPLAKAALVGTLLGPAVVFALGTGIGLLAAQASGAADQIEANQAAADLAARSSVLQLTVSEVHVTTTTDGSIVTGVRLRATVKATQDVRMATGGKTPWPQFSLTEQGSYVPLGSPALSGPAVLVAGSTTTYDLSFESPQAFARLLPGIVLASTYEPATPGTWALRMDLFDTGGVQYQVTTDVVIKAGS